MKFDKIFVSKQAGIGDVVLLTPILAELKRQFPNSKNYTYDFSECT